MPNGWWYMPPEPVPADPRWDEDLAWLDRDPERETWLDRAREHDDNSAPEDAEFTADEIANALGESRNRADELMGTAGYLHSHLPGTRAALRDGTLSLGKARIIVNATGLILGISLLAAA